MHHQILLLGLLAVSLPKAARAASPEANVPAPDSAAYSICETYPDGSKLRDLSPCSKARLLEDVVCKYNPHTGEAPHKTLQRHASCLCNSEFFIVKKACHRCVRGHGGMSEQQNNFYDEALGNAHRNFCQVDTPPDIFAKVWLDEVDAPSGKVFAGNTALMDEFGPSTDVRLYYTTDTTDKFVWSTAYSTELAYSTAFTTTVEDASSTTVVSLASPVIKLGATRTTIITAPLQTGNGTWGPLMINGSQPANFSSSRGDVEVAAENGTFVLHNPFPKNDHSDGSHSHVPGRPVVPVLLALTGILNFAL